MDRLTHERCNGIKTGYWSAAKKEELIQRLAAYENTGLEPEQIEVMMAPCITVSMSDEEARTLAKSICTGHIVPCSERSWVSVEDRLPEGSDEQYIVMDESGNIFNATFESDMDEGKQWGSWHGYYDPHTLGFVDNEWQSYEGIEYWMPIPKLPKEV